MNDTDEMNERGTLSKDDATRRDAYIGLAIVGFILVLALILSSVSGFGPYEGTSGEARAPTLWDWMELLIVPAVLALGALWFNKTQKDTELKIAEKARAADREIAEKARATDREIAESRQRQATLEAYYDRLTELLLKHDLRSLASSGEVRSIAGARTIAVVRNLDGERNRQLIAFLNESKLLKGVDPIINLSMADLGNVDLSSSDLSGTDLRGVDLGEAALSQTNLVRTNLGGADLRGADLRGANLHEANLREANLAGANLGAADLSDADLSEADLSSSDLSSADLTGSIMIGADLSNANMFDADIVESDLTGANLSSANLHYADLSGSDLSKANLSQTDLCSAFLTGACLSDTNLIGANLSGANLGETDLSESSNWTIEQLEEVETLEGATMPDGAQLGREETLQGERIRIEGPTFEEWKALYLAG